MLSIETPRAPRYPERGHLLQTPTTSNLWELEGLSGGQCGQCTQWKAMSLEYITFFGGETLEILPCKDSVGYPPLLGFFANELVIVFRGRAFTALVVCKDLDWGHLVTVFAVSEKRLCKELGPELHSGLKQKMNYSHLLRVCTKPSGPPAVGLHHTNLQGSWLGEIHSPFSQPCLPCTEVQSVQELDRNILSLSQDPCLSCSFGCYASFSCG